MRSTRLSPTFVAGKATPATLLLSRLSIAHTLHVYEPGRAGSFGAAGASALGVEPARMFKTLLAAVDGVLVCAVVPVGRSLDLKALAAAVGGKKAVMADPAAAERSSGYVVGGISPLGQKAPLRTVVDHSAMTFLAVHVSGGRRGLSVELAPGDLVRACDAVVAAVAR
ncbi:MAG: Cys-tRNA(Pro) deacylase [Mycobacteriales bacterium]